MNYKLAKAKRTRRAASEFVRTLRTLAAAPTSVSAQAPQATPRAPDIEPSSAPPARVEPERLSIGSGFVGSI